MLDDKENKQEKIIGKYKILEEIAEGGFGKVYLSEHCDTMEKYALKELKLRNGHSKIDPRQEVEIHKKVVNSQDKRSKYFIKLYEDFTIGNNLYLALEYCKNGSLRSYVKKNGPLEIFCATNVLIQLREAVEFMHEQNIVHRDLSTNNVLIWKFYPDKGRIIKLSVKIIDFGLSKQTGNKNEKDKNILKTNLGTPGFVAPEVREGKYTKEVDVYALGSVFYYMLMEKSLPLNGRKKEFEENLMGSRCFRKLDSDETRTNLLNFILGMLCRENERIRLKEFNNHDFIKWYTKKMPSEFKECGSSTQNDYRRRSQSSNPDPRRRRQPSLTKRTNKDSALGTDRSSSKACKHEEQDKGVCLGCALKITSNKTNDRNEIRTNSNRNVCTFDTRQHHVKENLVNRPPSVLRTQSQNILHPSDNRKRDSQMNRPPSVLTTQSHPIKSDNKNKNKIHWPFPIITNTWEKTNKYGKCSFTRYSDLDDGKGAQWNRVAILEKYDDKSIENTMRFELWQKGRWEQKLRIYSRKENCWLKSIYNENDLRGDAEAGYKTLLNFWTMASDRIIEEWCEEMVGKRKYTLYLFHNGFVKLIVEDGDTKATFRQRSNNAEFKLVDGDGIYPLRNLIDDYDVQEYGKELASALRIRAKDSIIRKFDGRNICWSSHNNF